MSELGGYPVAAVARAGARAIRQVAARVPGIVAATVLSDFAAPGQTLVGLDTAPEVGVAAQSILGVYGKGTRVRCLTYPPRGLLVLGPVNDSGKSELSIDRLRIRSSGDVSPSSTLHSLQIGRSAVDHMKIDGNEIAAFTAAIAGVSQPGVLALQNDGGQLVVPDLRAVGNHVNGNITTTSVTYTPTGTGGNPPTLTLPFPASGSVVVAVSARNTPAAAAAAVFGFELRISGGAVQYAADDQRAAIVSAAGVGTSVSHTMVLTGLPVTGIMRVEGQIRSSVGGTSVSFREMDLAVIPCL